MPTELTGSKDKPPAVVPSALDIKVQENKGAKPVIAFAKAQVWGEQNSISEGAGVDYDWENENLAIKMKCKRCLTSTNQPRHRRKLKSKES